MAGLCWLGGDVNPMGLLVFMVVAAVALVIFCAVSLMLDPRG